MNDYTARCLIRLGRAQEKIKVMLLADDLDRISKHDPYFHDDNAEMDEKLEKIRHRLNCLTENISDLYEILIESEE